MIANQPVGIDIEEISPRKKFYFDALATEAEWDQIGEQNMHHFYRLWTAKEAALKANGLGIGHLAECRLIDVPDASHLTVRFGDRDWPIEQFRHQGHIAAVTAGSCDVAWTVTQAVQ